jgi:hypothetical protein
MNHLTMKRVNLSEAIHNKKLLFDVYDIKGALLLRNGAEPNLSLLIEKAKQGVYVSDFDYRKLLRHREAKIVEAFANPRSRLLDL